MPSPPLLSSLVSSPPNFLPNMAQVTGALTAPGSVSLTTKLGTDTLTQVAIYGTYGSVSFLIEGTLDGTYWFTTFSVEADTAVAATGTISPSDNSSLMWKVPSEGLAGVRARVTAISTGTVNFYIQSSAFVGTIFQASNITGTATSLTSNTLDAASATSLTIGPSTATGLTLGKTGGSNTLAGNLVQTTNSSTGLVSGRQGSTNPTLQVDSSTGSCITGIKITSAASGNGVDVAAAGSTNEPMTLEAKGTGALKLNATTACTGAVQMGGAASGNNATGITVTPAAANSGVAIAAVSTSGNENLTVNAKGSGQMILGGTSTGLISLGRGSTNVVIESGTKTTLSSGTAVTATAAQLLGGYIVVSGQTAATTLTFDTGTNIDTAIPGVATGDSFYVTVFNANTSSGTVTLTGASGSTLRGTAAVPISKAATLFLQRTNTAAWDVVSTVSA